MRRQFNRKHKKITKSYYQDGGARIWFHLGHQDKRKILEFITSLQSHRTEIFVRRDDVSFAYTYIVYREKI